MPTPNGYTLGDDVSLVINTGSGLLRIAVTEFKAEAHFVDLKTRPIGQKPVHDVIPDGWSGSFKVDRTDPTIDNYFAALEANYWNNGPVQPPGTIQEFIAEADGSVTQWSYSKVALKFGDAGTFAGPKRVEQTLQFMASSRDKVK